MNCCWLGTGSCLALSDALSWVIRRSSFRLCKDLLKRVSFFFSLLATPFPILLESMHSILIGSIPIAFKRLHGHPMENISLPVVETSWYMYGTQTQAIKYSLMSGIVPISMAWHAY